MNPIIRWLLTFLVRNWKTSLTGAIGWMVTVFFKDRLVAAGIDPTNLLASIVALIAVFAKDGDKSNAPKPLAESGSTLTSGSGPEIPAGG